MLRLKDGFYAKDIFWPIITILLCIASSITSILIIKYLIKLFN